MAPIVMLAASLISSMAQADSQKTPTMQGTNSASRSPIGDNSKSDVSKDNKYQPTTQAGNSNTPAATSPNGPINPTIPAQTPNTSAPTQSIASDAEKKTGEQISGSASGGTEAASSSGNTMGTIANLAGSVIAADSQKTPGVSHFQNSNHGNIASDENKKVKESIEEAGGDITKIFGNIDAYLYKYKPEFQNDPKANADTNVGIMAQDLASNPITAPSVKRGDDGYLEVDGARLSSINAAVLSELCKKVAYLESVVNGGKY